MDPATGEAAARWPTTDQVEVGPAWVSGYYLADVVATSGPLAGTGATVPFVVREATARHSKILVVAALNTWEAYNPWGGKSLYAFNSTNGVAASKVSFDRPFEGFGVQGVIPWEYNFARFAERAGLDVSYTTDVDVDANPNELEGHDVIVVPGHSEYWTKSMRDAYEGALGHRVNLVFLGADTAYTQIRFEDDRRTVVEYRTAAADPVPDPSTKTENFRLLDPPRPECQLIGVQYQGGNLGNGFDGYVVAPGAASNAWFAGTGLMPGSVVANAVTYEYDATQPGCPVPGQVDVLFQQPAAVAGHPPAQAATFTAPSGARVFAAGSMGWDALLDDYGHPGTVSPGIQRFTVNMLNDLAGGPS